MGYRPSASWEFFAVVDDANAFHNQIIEAIRSGEVVCLFFPRIGKTLVLDMRHTIEVPPDVIIDEMVSRPSERLERLAELRPMMPPPDEISIAPWSGSVATLRESGVADAILERCAATGDDSAVQRCRQVFERLQRLERRHLRAIVEGRMARTIWERGPGSL